ncbi:hypothetical protein [Staphylococcus epidermidis]|uniref:hypothetical protein n=1 Tax=Staphylococcus epidermidis TaxID=1282 RepID=UPI001E52920B|nr:hypothetical protein [Staphylococcus epidermidis]
MSLKTVSLIKEWKGKVFMNINIQRFEEKCVEDNIKLIHRAMLEINIADYSKEDLIKNDEKMTV